MEQFWLPSLDYLETVLKFNLSSVVDILIVAFIMYRIMLLIKGTRAVQLLKGIAVLLVISAFSSLFNLYTISWLLGKALTALAVALPVVFQPELRRALEKLGRGKILVPASLIPGEFNQARLVAEITRSATILSKNKMGALIVLERETGLEEHIDTGVKIDGVVSAEFLVNIFVPKTPLHDGAVIIRGGRVVAAACFLPLSESPYLTSDLGTRHRAGIGITEHSDAVAVIVSEETGAISVAVEGVITRNYDEAGLQARLTELLKYQAPHSLSAFWPRRA